MNKTPKAIIFHCITFKKAMEMAKRDSIAKITFSV
jgi:hypothetical protein